jgi:hypothetical protein
MKTAQQPDESRKEWRDRIRKWREIDVTIEARCDNCRRWGSMGPCNSFTLASPYLCRGVCKGRGRTSVSITNNGINPNLYVLTPDERTAYADDIAEATKEAKEHGRATKWVPA